MADVATTFSTLSIDAPNVWIAQQMIALADRNLILGRWATRHELPQGMGKTLRVVRPRRLSLPTTALTEGTPPDAVALAVDNVDVTVEQWGIVVLLTDVAQITTKHPALRIAIDRSSLVMAELLERDIATVLQSGANVYYGGDATSRATIDAADTVATSNILKATSFLRDKGAPSFDGGLYGGALPPQVEADLLAADVVFRAVSELQGVRKFEIGEIGTWMGVRWVRGNFLPKLRGHAAPDTAAETAYKPKVTAVDGGGTIVSATNFKFQVVYRDKVTDRELRTTQPSANIASAATGNNESFTIDVAAADLTNYVYDVYMTVAGGAGSLFKVKSRIATAQTTITAVPAGTEATAPAAPASAVEVFTSFVLGRDGYGRVELNGMSLKSYITPAEASYSNPLAQGRKVGSKIMWKAFVMDGDYFVRLESASAYSANLPA